MTNTPADYILADLFPRRLDPTETAVQFLAAYPGATITPDALTELAASREAARRAYQRQHVVDEISRVESELAGARHKPWFPRVGAPLHVEQPPATPEYLTELRTRLEAF